MTHGLNFIQKVDKWLPGFSERYPMVLVVFSYEADVPYAPSRMMAYFGGREVANAGGDCERFELQDDDDGFYEDTIAELEHLSQQQARSRLEGEHEDE